MPLVSEVAYILIKIYAKAETRVALLFCDLLAGIVHHMGRLQAGPALCPCSKLGPCVALYAIFKTLNLQSERYDDELLFFFKSDFTFT